MFMLSESSLLLSDFFGVTDEIGFRPARDKVHVHDFHATILKLMGLGHEVLSVNQNGLDLRITAP